MFVKNCLIPLTKVTTISTTDSLKLALSVMEDHGHDALPVVNQTQQLVGVLSKQHVYKIFFLNPTDKEMFLHNTTVAELMKTDFKYVSEDEPIEAAIKKMTRMRMQFIVVFDRKQRFCGILTRRNLLEAMANSLGMDKQGVRVEVVVDDIEGRLAALTKVLAKSDYNILSLMMIDPKVAGLQKVTMRIDTRDEKRLVAILTESGFKILTSMME